MKILVRKRVFRIIVSIELIILVVLTVYIGSIYLRKPSVEALHKEDLLLSKVNGLKYFYEHRPNIVFSDHPSWLSYKATYTINGDGFNQQNTENFPVKKKSGTFRIMTLGDSFTFGAFVNTKDNYPSQLEDMLNKLSCTNIKKFEVINLGVPGYDIQYALERYKLRGVKYHPDLVLWLLKDDDIEEINELEIPKEETYKKRLTASGEYQKLMQSGIFYSDWGMASSDVISEYGLTDIQKLQRHFLDQFRSLYNGKLALLTFPFTKEENREFIKSFASSDERNYYFENLPNIYTLGEALPDKHANVKGNLDIAKHIYADLLKNNIINCHE